MQLTLDVPEQYLLDSSPAALGRRIQLYAALLMFQTGEVSAGAGAEFAGVDRLTFAAECQRLGIPLIDYPADELRGELRSFGGHGY
jgi:predicted HTH domain antitoxin